MNIINEEYPESFYRFRPLKWICDEIEQEYLFFSKPTDLNDPLEGFQDIYFSGDILLWNNLLLHYFGYLQKSIFDLREIGKPYNLDLLSNIQYFESKRFLKRPSSKCVNKFIIEHRKLRYFIKRISAYSLKNKLLISDLQAILSILTIYYYRRILKINFYSGIIPFLDAKKIQSIELLRRLIVELDIFDKPINSLFDAIESQNEQFRIIVKYNDSEKLINHSLSSFILGFSKNYCQKIKTLILNNWHNVSFSTHCSNAAIWGYYAENHKGVCLEYNQKISPKVTMQGKKYSTPLSSMKMHKVDYNCSHIEIDFFNEIGTIPKQQLIDDWYADDSGNTHPYKNKLDNDDWLSAHWDKLSSSLIVKTHHWRHESEYRLVHFNIDDRDVPTKDKICYMIPDQKIKYGFNHLQGIIFGIKTPDEIRNKILKIIENKYQINSNLDIKFYQAYYNHEKELIDKKHLDYIKF